MYIHRTIEIKKTAIPNKSFVSAFTCLNKLDTPIGHGALICLANQFLPLTSDVDVVPIGYV